jgi:hypothetical protein
VRAVTGKLPTNEPVTLTTKLVGAGPVGGRSHNNEIRLPAFVALRFDGDPGMPLHGPGMVTITTLASA